MWNLRSGRGRARSSEPVQPEEAQEVESFPAERKAAPQLADADDARALLGSVGVAAKENAQTLNAGHR